ncbi:MAG: ROK family protein [Clostridia bacterium]|nr:ROK family protein [Clostridia bacterium]
MNRLKVVDFIRHHPDVSRAIIAQGTGLSLASITNITTYLLEKGIITETGVENAVRVGRKGALLRFCAQRYTYICCIIEDRVAHVLLTDMEGNILVAEQIGTQEQSLEDLLEEMGNRINRLRTAYPQPEILGVGVSVSGIVVDDGRFLVSTHMKRRSVELRQTLEDMTGLPVFVDNVSYLRATQYFFLTDYQKDKNRLFVDMEDGIGAMQFFGGAITKGTLGEIGHTTLKRDGEPCFCGNRGCLEVMCSPKRLLSLYEGAAGRALAGLSELEALYTAGDENAVFAVEECGAYLGIGLANLVNLFNPSALVINTGDFTLCPSLFAVAEKELRRRAYSALAEDMVIGKVDITREELVLGMAYHLCDRILEISCPHNIVE